MTFSGGNWLTTSSGAYQLCCLPVVPRPTHMMLGRGQYPFTAAPARRRRCLTLTTVAGREVVVSEDQRLYGMVAGGVPAEVEAQWLSPGMLLALDDQRGSYGGSGTWQTGFLAGCGTARCMDQRLAAKVTSVLEEAGYPTILAATWATGNYAEEGRGAGYVAGYLSGVCNTRASFKTVSSVSILDTLPTIQMIQRMLLRHGVLSSINSLVDGPALRIKGTAAGALSRVVEWHHSVKRERFNALQTGGAVPLFQDEILSIEPAGVQDTFAITADYVGRACVNGFLCPA